MKAVVAFFIAFQVFLLNSSILYGQSSFKVHAGVGVPELAHAGVSIQLGQFQLGLYGGTMPMKEERIFSVLGDVRFHFAGKAKHSDTRPWYARVGVDYMWYDTLAKKETFVYLVPRLGRELHFSRRFGLELDIGALLQLAHEEVRKMPPPDLKLNIRFPSFLSFGLGFFYTFY